MGKNLPSVQQTGFITGLGISLGEGKSYPLKYSCLENSMDRGAWQAKSMGSQRVRHDLMTNSDSSQSQFFIMMMEAGDFVLL